MFHQLLEVIKEYNRIIIHRHDRPDGDAMGSQIGLRHILRDSFPEKEIYAVGDDAGHLSFMADSVMDTVSDEAYDGALAIILDCGASHLISDDRYTKAAATMRMDHHLFREKIAQVELVDSSYESCAGLVTSFARECGLTVSRAAAEALYTGMVTDSGRFRYDAVSATTFRNASFLMERGVDTNAIFRELYANDLEQVKQRAAFVQRIQLTSRRVAWVYTTREQLAEMKMEAHVLSRGMVNTMADIRGVDFWVNFTEDEDRVLCELRSSRYDVSGIAVKYGGGGHARASGAAIRNREEAMAMLADLDQLMAEVSGEAQ